MALSRSIQLIPLAKQFQSLVQMERFTSPEKLKDAIICSQKCTSLEFYNGHVSTSFSESRSECCLVHPLKKQTLLCEHCTVEICRDCAFADHKSHGWVESSTVIREERRKLNETLNSVTDELEDMKQKISGVKEMKRRVRNRENENISVTREVFATLRKIIDDREEKMISSIKQAAVKRQKALEVN